MTTPKTQPRYGDLRLLGRLLSEARPYAPHLVTLLLLGLLATPLVLLLPLPLKIAVDSVLGDAPVPGFLAPFAPATKSGLLLFCALLVVGVALVLQVQGLATWMLETWVGEKVVLRFRARIFRHLQYLSLRFHDQSGSAEASYRVLYDAPSIQHVAVQGLIPLATALTRLVVMITVIWTIDRSLALVALCVCPVFFVLTEVYRRRLRKRWSRAKEHESRANAVVQESLSSLRVVKAFGQQERERDRYEAHAKASLAAHLHAVFAQGGFTLLTGLTTAAGTAAVLWLGVTHVQDGSITLGALLLVMGYLTQLYEPLREVGSKLTDVQRSMAGAERAFTLLDEVPETADRPGARALERAAGAFELRGVGFAYDPKHSVLHDVSFSVPAGSRVGIEGRTGAGKTTLMSLLPRFYDPTSGAILLDGVDLRDYRLLDLRNQFAIVLQEPVLFSTSIRENIAYGRPGATEEEIVAAAKAANAHDFVLALPEGYDTQVGERGARLSGGERQRVSLARAFLKDAPVLLLDEPTSSVDVGTEDLILEALERLMKGRTTFVIAHRLRTLDGCDVRLQVGEGRVEALAVH